MPFLTDVFPEPEVSGLFSLVNQWKEVAAEAQPGGGEAFTAESGEAAIVVQITPAQRRSFLRVVLGFACVDNSRSVPLFHRDNPIRHPVYPWLFATSVSFTQFPPGVPPIDPVTGNAQKTTPGNFTNPPINPANAPPKFGSYKVCYATVKFTAVRETFLTDAELALVPGGSEISRNVFWDTASEVQMLSAEGARGAMQWAETGPGGPPLPGPPDAAPVPGSTIQQAFGTLVSKTTYICNWTRVPHEWVSSAPFPACRFTKFEQCQGTVNALPFGPSGADPWPPGTVVMQPAKFSPMRWSVATVAAPSDGAPPVFAGWNIQIPFQFFQPVKATATAGTAFQGFRCLPWPVDGNFYGATRTNTNKFLLQEADLNSIFTQAG